MLIISYGIGKSASSFVHQILEGILLCRYASYDEYVADLQENIPEGTVSNGLFHIETQEVEELLEGFPRHRYALLKTHDVPDRIAFSQGREPELSNSLLNAVSSRTLVLFASIRHPIEVALSSVDHGLRARKEGENSHFADIYTVYDAVPHVKSDYNKIMVWGQCDDVFWCPYDKVVLDPKVFAKAAAKYIGLPHIDTDFVVDEIFSKGIHQFNKGKVGRSAELELDDLEALSDIFSREIKIYEKVLITAGWS